MTATCKNSAVDFLMYSYFGYDWRENPYYCAIDRAYNDATLRAALVLKKNFKNRDGSEEEVYNKLYKKTEKIRANIKRQLKAMGTEIIRKYVDLITHDDDFESFVLKKELAEKIRQYMPKDDIVVPFENQEKYNIWHNALCDSLVNYYDDQYVALLSEIDDTDAKKLALIEEYHQQYFSYGNAQKWVNMTMKNLYIISIMQHLLSEEDNQDSDSWYERIISCSKYFHIPLDSYMFDAIQDLDIKPDFQTNEKESTSSWSKIGDYEKYKKYQGSVKEKIGPYINPIDWEGPIWIKQAKKVKAHDKKNDWESCYEKGRYPLSSPKE